MVRANEKQVIHHEELEDHEEFWPSAKRGGGARRKGCTVTSANMVMYEVLNPATAFFMSFMLFMVKHILGSGRRPVCVTSSQELENLSR